jgi:hypothetical protein
MFLLCTHLHTHTYIQVHQCVTSLKWIAGIRPIDIASMYTLTYIHTHTHTHIHQSIEVDRRHRAHRDLIYVLTMYTVTYIHTCTHTYTRALKWIDGIGLIDTADLVTSDEREAKQERGRLAAQKEVCIF